MGGTTTPIPKTVTDNRIEITPVIKDFDGKPLKGPNSMILSEKNRRYTKEYDDLWCTKELIWEKVYKVMAQGRIIDVNHYSIEGKLF